MLYLEHKGLYNLTGPVSDADLDVIGRASVVREGSDITLVASQLMRHRALEAAELLAAENVSAEVIDPRTMVPVSYTHLDVYKRQVLRNAGGRR